MVKLLFNRGFCPLSVHEMKTLAEKVPSINKPKFDDNIFIIMGNISRDVFNDKPAKPGTDLVPILFVFEGNAEELGLYHKDTFKKLEAYSNFSEEALPQIMDMFIYRGWDFDPRCLILCLPRKEPYKLHEDIYKSVVEYTNQVMRGFGTFDIYLWGEKNRKEDYIND